jgi:hypothetical protein
VSGVQSSALSSDPLSSDPDPDEPESSDPDPELLESSSRRSSSSTGSSSIWSGADVVGETEVATELFGETPGPIEGVVDLVVGATLVDVGAGTVAGFVVGADAGAVVGVVAVEGTATVVGVGSGGGTGFCHTEAGLDEPMLGNRLSPIAFATPTTPSVASTVRPTTTTTARQPEVRVAVGGVAALSRSTLDDENTGARSQPAISCPCSSHWSLTEPFWQARPPAPIGRWS